MIANLSAPLRVTARCRTCSQRVIGNYGEFRFAAIGTLLGLVFLVGTVRFAHGDDPDSRAPSLARSLVAYPPRVVLTGSVHHHRLVIEERRGPDDSGDVTERVTFSSTKPDVAVIDRAGEIIPKGNGETTLTAKLGELSVAVPVRVTRFDERIPWSFRNDVQTVLSKAGCNMGACHGAQAGKNGFKLTLRGYDPFADFDTITRQARGRRVSPRAPAQSLLLLKATGAVPHGGGERFDTDALDYRVIAEWVAEGAKGPSDRDPVIDRLEVQPRQALLRVGDPQRLLVLAHYTDGSVRDVSSWAKYSSTEVGVAEVSAEGRVNVVGHGEAAISVWFASRVATTTISSPFDNTTRPEQFAVDKGGNFIDEIVHDKLRRLKLPPQGRVSDGKFARRAFLTTLGVLPTEAELDAFENDTRADKRARLIDTLLERPEFVDYWAYQWAELLLINSKRLKPAAVSAFYTWVREAVRENRPWDRFVRDILTAQGSTLENGATNFFVLHKDPKDLTETATVTFLGLSIACARCHDHPLERWTLDDYYGMANLFARVRMKDAAAEGELIVFAAREGEIAHPTRNRPPTPRPLDGQPFELTNPGDRRAHLAQWMTARENPYFARAFANRVWANFLGRGLVESIDDLRVSNPASNERLLSALASDFADHRYDVKHLMRAILNSATFQRVSESPTENHRDDRFYSRYLPHRLKAEVLLDALSHVTGVPTTIPGYPKGTRVLQLPDSNVNLPFLATFGRPVRDNSCSCERSQETSPTQVLHMTNGDTLLAKMASKESVLETWWQSDLKLNDVARHIFRGALSRSPTEAELKQLETALAEKWTPKTDDETQRKKLRREAIEDLVWAVLNTREFLFVH